MAKQIEDSHGESNKEEVMKQLDKEYEAYLRFSGSDFDWVEALIGVIMTVIAVGFSSLNIAYLIEMVIEHKFVTWKAAIHIFWAIVLLGQWVYHWANTLIWKLK